MRDNNHDFAVNYVDNKIESSNPPPKGGALVMLGVSEGISKYKVLETLFIVILLFNFVLVSS